MQHLPPSADRLARRIRRKIDELASNKIDVLDFFIWYVHAADIHYLYDAPFTAALLVLDEANNKYHGRGWTEEQIREMVIAARPLFVVEGSSERKQS